MNGLSSNEATKNANKAAESTELKIIDDGKQNILIEKNFLNYYTNVFKTELFLYVMLGNIICYMGIAFAMK
jgi:high-affinity Fe2+/Pb2+ permease